MVESSVRRSTLGIPRQGGRAVVELTVRGNVPAAVREYAVAKLARLDRYAGHPVRAAHVVLTLATDPARTRPAIVEATLDVDGYPVRAQVASESLREAVDLLDGRLRRQLVHHADRERTRHRWIGLAAEHEWRHGDVGRAPEQAERRAAERSVRRRKTVTTVPMSPDEAAFDMDLLGHDFLLFTDAETGSDAVVHRTAHGRYRCIGDVKARGSLAARDVSPAEAVQDEAGARARLDASDDRFVFWLDPRTGRGRVLYRRYDGDYGLLAAGSPDR